MAELIWEGKYLDPDRRVKASPVRIALPFQTVETVNESAQERQKSLEALWAGKRETEWRNRLIWGDKKYVLPSLLDEFAGKVDLIYIDPPFNTGADFSFHAKVPEDGLEFTKEASVIEQRAYRDTWSAGIDGYIHWLFETAALLFELLSDSGSFFLHLDPNYGHYAKVMLDEIFRGRFQNEIIWQRTDAHNDAKNRYGFIHDCIYWFSKAEKPLYCPDAVRTGLNPGGLKEYSLIETPDGRVVPYTGNENVPGRRFKLDDATWKGAKNRFPWRGCTPGARREWRYASIDDMEAAYHRGEIYLRNPEKGVLRCLKSYLDENEGLLLQDIWTDAGRMKGGGTYATEKPEPLLKRIILSTTTEGQLVLDCFVGSGTAAAVAEKLGRRWIACDLGRFAIHTTRKRLLQIPDVKPFVVQNLGKYERQAWQAAEFGEDAAEKTLRYRKFILELYKADAVTGYEWFHGSKASRFVHVGTVDSPVSVGDVTAICA